METRNWSAYKEQMTPDSWAPSRVSVLHSFPRGSGIHEGEGQKYCKSRGWQVTAREGGRCTHQLSKAVTTGVRPAQCGPDKDPSMEEGKQASGPSSSQEQSTFDCSWAREVSFLQWSNTQGRPTPRVVSQHKLDYGFLKIEREYEVEGQEGQYERSCGRG